MNTLLKKLALSAVALSLNAAVQAGALDTDTLNVKTKAIQQKQKQVQIAKNNEDAYTNQAKTSKEDAKVAKKAKKELANDVTNLEQDVISTVKQDLNLFQRHKDKILWSAFGAISFFVVQRWIFPIFYKIKP